MNTNLGKTKEEIIFEIVLSMNKGNIKYYGSRVCEAIDQYDELVRRGIIVEIPDGN